jgi:hypothetical protein
LEEVQPQRYQTGRDGPGVPLSPFSHDVNDATGVLLKTALRDAAVDGVGRVAWAPGRVHAARATNGAGDGLTAYYGNGQTPGIMGANLQRIIERVTGERPAVEQARVATHDDPARALEAGHYREEYPSVRLSDQARDIIRKTGLPIYSVPFAVGAATTGAEDAKP